MNYCNECKFHVGLAYNDDTCKNLKSISCSDWLSSAANLVINRNIGGPTCASVRGDERGCGIEGKWFEKKGY